MGGLEACSFSGGIREPWLKPSHGSKIPLKAEPWLGISSKPSRWLGTIPLATQSVAAETEKEHAMVGWREASPQNPSSERQLPGVAEEEESYHPKSPTGIRP